MSRTVYALLVGVNNYPDPIPSLRGCVNDARALEAYLRERIESPLCPCRIRTLTDDAATRGAVIDGFRDHLCGAGGDDVALFYFSGHGSQQPAPEEWWDQEPDRLNETLVCWDSRAPGGWDLADKELAQLIAEVAARGPQIAVILDCCHSGSGTRGDSALAGVRGISADQRQRPLGTLIRPPLASARGSSATSYAAWAEMSAGRHVVLAACQDREQAYEYRIQGAVRGAFSYFLIDALSHAGGALTYRDLFKRTNTLVRSFISVQSPRLEATIAADLDLPFLGGAVSRAAHFTAAYHREYGWAVDAGALHGMPQPSADGTARLALFSFDSAPSTLHDRERAVAFATVTSVLPHISQVELDLGGAQADPHLSYRAMLIDLPLTRLHVALAGEGAGLEPLRRALDAHGDGDRAALYLTLVDDAADAAFHVVADGGAYTVTRAGDRREVGRVEGYSEASAARLADDLGRIARWTNFVQLTNPTPLRLAIEDVAIEIYQLAGSTPATLRKTRVWPSDNATSVSEVRLSYIEANGSWIWPKFEVRLANRRADKLPLFCALLALADDYSITNLLPGGCVRLDPGETTAVRMGGQVSDSLWRRGITEARDILKLLACTDEFDATLLEQQHDRTTPRAVSAARAGVFSRLMSGARTRTLVRLDEEDDRYDDWIASEIGVTVVRPAAATAPG